MAEAASLVEPGIRAPDIAKALEEDIIFGRLHPGDRLIEDTLAARFDVTRHFVREALYELERLGIVVRERNRGATVRALGPRAVRQMYHVRELLQREAALLIPLPAPSTLIERLREINAGYAGDIESGNFRGIHEANERFHRTLFAACGNPYLVHTIEYYMRISLPVRAKPLADPALLTASREQHELMIKLLQGKNNWLLAQLCAEHLQPSMRAYLVHTEPAPPGEDSEE
jgi:DNA-binding GntR family transcriptional regulator